MFLIEKCDNKPIKSHFGVDNEYPFFYKELEKKKIYCEYVFNLLPEVTKGKLVTINPIFL